MEVLLQLKNIKKLNEKKRYKCKLSTRLGEISEMVVQGNTYFCELR